MKKRDRILLQAKIMGYHNDIKGFTRLRIEARIAQRLLKAAFQQGRVDKDAGWGCSCADCNPTPKEAK